MGEIPPCNAVPKLVSIPDREECLIAWATHQESYDDVDEALALLCEESFREAPPEELATRRIVRAHRSTDRPADLVSAEP